MTKGKKMGWSVKEEKQATGNGNLGGNVLKINYIFNINI